MQYPSPNSPNPFSDAANPCAAPTYAASAMAGPLVPFTRDEVRLRLLGPAIGLGIFSVLWLMYVVVVLVVTVIDSGRMLPNDNVAEAIGFVIGTLLVFVLGFVPAVVTLVGAVQMIRVKTYYLCWTAAILGVVPRTLCLPFTVPFGIWGLVVLYDARTKLAFYGASPFVNG